MAVPRLKLGLPDCLLPALHCVCASLCHAVEEHSESDRALDS